MVSYRNFSCLAQLTGSERGAAVVVVIGGYKGQGKGKGKGKLICGHLRRSKFEPRINAADNDNEA